MRKHRMELYFTKKGRARGMKGRRIYRGVRIIGCKALKFIRNAGSGIRSNISPIEGDPSLLLDSRLQYEGLALYLCRKRTVGSNPDCFCTCNQQRLVNRQRNLQFRDTFCSSIILYALCFSHLHAALRGVLCYLPLKMYSHKRMNFNPARNEGFHLASFLIKRL